VRMLQHTRTHVQSTAQIHPCTECMFQQDWPNQARDGIPAVHARGHRGARVPQGAAEACLERGRYPSTTYIHTYILMYKYERK
jgi:hypothetical protein